MVGALAGREGVDEDAGIRVSVDVFIYSLRQCKAEREAGQRT